MWVTLLHYGNTPRPKGYVKYFLCKSVTPVNIMEIQKGLWKLIMQTTIMTIPPVL